MKSQAKNYAYVDGANLHKANKELGWELDYQKFRVWLTEKYGVQRAYLFIGLIPRNKDLYTYLQECGFTLVFKEVIYDGAGKPKGNCDAELVLQAARDSYEDDFQKAVIVASDGDYAGLVKFLIEKQRLLVVLSPNNTEKCSVLLKRTGAKIAYLNDQRSILEKAPGADGTAQGSLS